MDQEIFPVEAVLEFGRLTITCMRYWNQAVDEDYERERERAIHLGTFAPAPVTVSETSVIVVLVAGEILLWLGLVVAAALRLAS